MFACPAALQGIAICDDFVRIEAERSEIIRVEIGGAEALIHKNPPLLRIGAALKPRMLRIEAV